MILLISQDEFEITTDLVYDWIKHLGGEAIRLNGVNLLNEDNFKIEIAPDQKQYKVNINNINLDDISIIWYRRWMYGNYRYNDNQYINDYLKKEFQGFSRYLFSSFSEDKWYNRHPLFQNYPTKTEQLNIAKEIGFKTPETLITNNKKSLVSFVEKHGSVITKSINEIPIIPDKKNSIINCAYTEKITSKEIVQIPDSFFPSLFQQEIKKKLELRVFIERKEIYSMAIISNKNKQTEVDFRNYDNTKPNRCLPFNLTEREKDMIFLFMDKINLSTGSIDFIYDYQNELIFLEINPLGQFGMVSAPCNYYIEKKIAQNLIKIDNEKEKVGL